MAQAKKFGTFAGVFTPSILTILGVIMYLRLGKIVGEAGFYSALALILIAHVISISTGLSLSSIATDKKIKTGGIYYMLSRSLGLPMGGSIGITIFLGTALSISLYIVGFVENFLSIAWISDNLGMSGSINDIRIVGTLVIISLVVLAYISTSIAIKTQFVILGAIALSLVSIVVGIFINPETQASAPALMPVANSPDLIVLFAIFFPAVTGFTAGVAMSGDLKSPKDSIPKGTLWAIGIGLLAYFGLTALFAFYVDRDLLLTDTNFLQKVAWSFPLVVAGIWGATLSSALGGILGGPRILQAMSADKVTHKFFAKGVGESNEPRRALVLTFILAEVGILIGQLDVIAGIVSMFYIAAYGFINLAYVLERWANSDFRPSMKISIWVGIIGFVASIGVMLKLDTLGMVAAFGIMFGIYIFLKRREVHGNMTDVWQSVWTSIIRTSLTRINKKPLSETNWQPNIVLFSGGGKSRPHLLELGGNIVGKQGFLSNFDLQVSKDSAFLFPKSKQKVAYNLDEDIVGVFTRRQSVSNLYDGIEMIAQTYGFSGVEPNTVMMGWARHSTEPARFSQLVYNLSALDMNVILLDYDKEHGWGNKQSIDIWWRGGGNNGNLALSLVKFITLSDDWAQAKIRLLIVNPNNDLSATIYENASRVLESLRIHAELRIINNETEQRSFYDIIKMESIDTDFIILGFPSIEKGKEVEFVEQTNKLCHNIGTVAIIKASSQFESLSLGEIDTTTNTDATSEASILSISKSINIKESLDTISKPQLAKPIHQLADDLESLSAELIRQIVSPVYEKQIQWLEQLHQSGTKSFDNLISRAPNNQVSTFKKSIIAQHHIFMRGQQQYIEHHVLGSLEKVINERLESVMASADEFSKSIWEYPYRIKSRVSKQEIQEATMENKKFRRRAAYLKPLFLFKSEIPYYVHIREFLLTHYPQSAYQVMYLLTVLLNKDGYQFENEVSKLMQKISDIFDQTLVLCKESVPTEVELKAQQQQISIMLQQLIAEQNKGLGDIVQKLKQMLTLDLNHVIGQINHPLPNAYIDYNIDPRSLLKKKKKTFNQSIGIWQSNKELADHVSQLNLMLLSFGFSSQTILLDLDSKLRLTTEENIGHPLKEIIDVLGLAKDKDQDSQKSFIAGRLKNIHSNLDIRIQQMFIDQYNYSLKKIKTSVSQFPEQLTIYIDSQMFIGDISELHPQQSIEVAIKRTIDYMVEKELLEIQEMIINLGQDINVLKAEMAEIMQMVLQASISDTTGKPELKKADNDSNLEYQEQIHLALDKAVSLNENLMNKQNLLTGILQKKIKGLKASLELYPFIRSVQDLKQYIKTAQTKRWFNRIISVQKHIHTFFSKQMNMLWYNQSSGFLLAQKLSKSTLVKETRVETLLEFREEVSPSATIMKKIPDYYKQLFLRRQFYLNEFWFGREEELAAFDDSFRRWKAGYSGGILVLGERNSGKSFFANYLDQKLEVKGDIYHLNPPYTGSVSVDDLLSNFQSVTEKQGSFAKIFNEIPSQSVFFIDDLELWWEKSANGMQVIDQLMSIINRFGQQHLFVVMSNIHSFSLINKYRKIENIFLGMIELRPFNARQLKEVVMRRHTTAAMSFVMNNTPESRYRGWNYARLFSRFFTYSEGNPGVALQAWLRSVEDVDKSTIFLKKPKTPDYIALRYLDTEWMIFIMHFLLHKRMNLSKLVRVSQESRAEVIRRIRILKRAGVIVETGDDILEIDQYILPFLRKALVKRELL